MGGKMGGGEGVDVHYASLRIRERMNTPPAMCCLAIFVTEVGHQDQARRRFHARIARDTTK